MRRRANFDLGTDGNTIGTGDAGSVDAWDDVSIAAGSTFTYDNDHAHSSPNGAKFSVAGVAANAYLGWTGLAASPTTYGRFYFYPTVDSDSMFIAHLRTDAGTPSAYLGWNATEQIFVGDSAGTGRGNGTISLALNELSRIEFRHIGNVSLQALVFVGANVDGLIPDETINSTGGTWGDTTTNIARFGSLANSANRTFWMDDIEINDTGYPGPTNPPMRFDYPQFPKTILRPATRAPY